MKDGSIALALAAAMFTLTVWLGMSVIDHSGTNYCESGASAACDVIRSDMKVMFVSGAVTLCFFVVGLLQRYRPVVVSAP
jgi:hypothetical protein